MEQAFPKVAINVVVVKDGKVLMGKRKGPNPGSAMYGTPGGHLEVLESLADCAVRELREEVDIEVQNMRFLCVTNVRAFPPKHYVMISVVVDWKSGEPKTCEPEACEGWDWIDPAHPPLPMTPATETALQVYLGTATKLFESTPTENASGETL